MKSCRGILQATVAVLATAVLQSCIVVPNLKSIKGTEEVSQITIGESSRDEVIALLGPPDVASDDSLLVYSWEKSRYFWAIGGGYTAGAGSGGHKGFRAVVEFDPNGQVVRVLSESSVDTPKQHVEDWGPIRGCGRWFTLPRAVAVSPDAKQTVLLIRNELCFAPTDDPGTARRVALGDAPWSRGNFGAFISFSPDGSRLAIASGGRRLTLWDIATDQEISHFGDLEGPKQDFFFPPRPVVFSPDGRRLAAPDINGEFVLWEIESGAEIFRHSPSSLVGTVAFSHDGTLIALGLWGGGLEVLDAGTGRRLLLRDGIPDSSDMAAAAFSLDGKWIAVSTPVHVELWELPTLRDSGWSAGRRAVFLLPFYRHTPASNMYVRPVVGFSSDGTTLAVFEHETITVIDVDSLAMRQIYRFRFPVFSVAFDPAWKRLALLSLNGLRVWDIPMDEQE
jgi:WD40 repeat protein